jgi:Protein of unknown function (DUF1682)
MKDLRDFAAKRSIAQLPQSLVCLADSNDLAQTVLPPAVVAALTQAAVHVQLIHLTDMVRPCSILHTLATFKFIMYCSVHVLVHRWLLATFSLVIASSSYSMACCGVTQLHALSVLDSRC